LRLGLNFAANFVFALAYDVETICRLSLFADYLASDVKLFLDAVQDFFELHPGHVFEVRYRSEKVN
jgi:hypothetical protein